MAKQKLFWGAIGALAVVGLVAGYIILSSIDFNQFKPEISAQVKAATGRELVISGDLDLQISFSPQVAVNGVTFSNAQWGSRKEMVSVKRLVARVKLLPLLLGNVQISQLTLEEPNVLIETDAKGTGNWQFRPAEKKSKEMDERAASPLPLVTNMRIDKARFTYRDGKSGEKKVLWIDTLEASADKLDSPLSLRFQGNYNAIQIEVSGTVDNVAGLVSGDAVALDLKAKTNGTETALAGSFTRAGELYHLYDLVLNLGESQMQGDISLDLGQKPPLLTVALSSEVIDLREPLSDTSTADAAGKQPAKKARLFPSDLLPVEGMRALSTEVTFNSSKILGPRYALNNVKILATLNKGMLKVEPITMAIGGGQLNSSLTLDANKLPASLDLRISGHSLDLGKMLAETGVTDLVTGAVTRIEVGLKGRGRSIATLMGSLSGKALLDVSKGKINNKYVNLAGADLVRQLVTALNPLAKREEFTNLECAVVNLQFKEGVATYDKRIAVETDTMTVVSSGEIDLGKETLDIGMKPKPRKDTKDLGIGAGDLVSAARLHGSLAKPELGLDALGTAKAGLKVYGAIATGGTSLLIGGLLDKAIADPHPCLTAMGKASEESNGAGKPSKRDNTEAKPKGKENGGGFFDSLKKKIRS